MFGVTQSPLLATYDEWSYALSLPREIEIAVTSLCNETKLVVKCLRVLDMKQVELAQITGHRNPTLRAILNVIEQWYSAVIDRPEYETKDSRHTINAFWLTMRMTLVSNVVEERIDKVHTAGKGWHWHFRTLYDFKDDIGDSQPKDAYDPDTALDNTFIFEADNPELYSTWSHEVMFRQEDMHLWRGSAFGFTTNGRMALLPSDVREGDHVCLFYGI